MTKDQTKTVQWGKGCVIDDTGSWTSPGTKPGRHGPNIPLSKINSEWAIDKSLKCKATKLLENDPGILDDLESNSDFLDMASKIDQKMPSLTLLIVTMFRTRSVPQP